MSGIVYHTQCSRRLNPGRRLILSTLQTDSPDRAWLILDRKKALSSLQSETLQLSRSFLVDPPSTCAACGITSAGAEDEVRM